MKRYDEEFCKKKFNEYIGKFYAPERIRWEDVPSDEEPPDYYLYLDGEKFAVEVTDLLERIDVGTKNPLPSEAIENILQNFVKSIQEEAITKGYLSGIYYLDFDRPVINFSTIQVDLRKQLLEFVHNTKDVEQTTVNELLFDYKLVCYIEKKGNTKNLIIPIAGAFVSGPTVTKGESDAEKDILTLLQGRIHSKAKKLKNVPQPIILLLLDNYHYASIPMYFNSLPAIPDTSKFHTIYVAVSDREGFILVSDNKQWIG